MIPMLVEDDMPEPGKPVDNQVGASSDLPSGAEFDPTAPLPQLPSRAETVRMMREHALGYATLGWKVFPLKSGDKLPIGGTHGHNEATSKYETVDHWWSTMYPGANIGIATGRLTGFFVLDVDQHSDDADMNGFLTLEKRVAQHGPLPQTLTARSPKGSLHIYFRMPSDSEVACSASMVGGGLDIRASGGYIVAPPSLRAEGPYRWLEGHIPGTTEIAEAPAWLLEAIKQNSERRKKAEHDPETTARLIRMRENPRFREKMHGYSQRALDCELQNIRHAPQGQRNSTLFASAFSIGQLAATGILEEESSKAALIQAALDNALDEREARDTVTRGFVRGLALPRMIPGAGVSAKRPMMTKEQAQERIPEILAGAPLEPAIVFEKEHLRALAALNYYDQRAYVRVRDEVGKHGVNKRELDKAVKDCRKEEESPDDAAQRQTREATKQATKVHFLGKNRGFFYYMSTHERQVVALKAADHGKLNLLQLAPLEFWEANFPSTESDDA
jgi:hypothetical protein